MSGFGGFGKTNPAMAFAGQLRAFFACMARRNPAATVQTKMGWTKEFFVDN